MNSKPHIYREHAEPDTKGWQHDVPLFSKWIVSYDVPAGCGHTNCGTEWEQHEFATWTDALKHALSLA